MTRNEREFKRLYGKEPTGFDLIQFAKHRTRPLDHDTAPLRKLNAKAEDSEVWDDHPFLPRPRSDFNRNPRKGHFDPLD